MIVFLAYVLVMGLFASPIVVGLAIVPWHLGLTRDGAWYAGLVVYYVFLGLLVLWALGHTAIRMAGTVREDEPAARPVQRRKKRRPAAPPG